MERLWSDSMALPILNSLLDGFGAGELAWAILR